MGVFIIGLFLLFFYIIDHFLIKNIILYHLVVKYKKVYKSIIHPLLFGDRMKKVFSAIIFSLIFLAGLSAAALAGNIEIDNFYAGSLSTPLTDVRTLVYTCADDSCSAPSGGAWFNQSSGSSNTETIEYPGTANEQHYAEFMLASCYIPKAFNVRDKGTGLTTTYDNVFNKVNNCKSLIDTFSVTNSVKPNMPVMVDINANLDANTYSAFNQINNVVGFFPGSVDYYSAETEVTLRIYDSNGQVVHQNSKIVDIYMDSLEHVHFEWIPTIVGEYTAEVSTKVIDCQCSSTSKQSASKIFTVVLESDTDYCYTLLNNLTINNANPKAGNFLSVSAVKISNEVDNNGNLNALATDTILKIYKQTTLVFDSSKTINANSDTINFQEFSYNTLTLQAGNYTVDMGAVALNCPFATNNAENETLFFTVTPSGAANNAPVVSITNPTVGATLKGIETVTWDASDADQADLNLDIKIEYKFNGNTWTVLEDGVNNNDGTFTWDTRTVPNANDYMLRITVKDNEGVEATDTVNQFTIGPNSPVVNITSPQVGNIWDGTRSILWSASDSVQADSTLDMLIEYRFNSASSWVVLENGTDNNDGTFTWDTTSVTDGNNYELRVTATNDVNGTGVDFVSQFEIKNIQTAGNPKTSAKKIPDKSRKKNIHINSIGFDQEDVKPDDKLYIFLNFENHGDIDLNNIRVKAIIRELGIRSRTIKAMVDDDEQSSKFLSLYIPYYAMPGTYYVEIVIDLDGERRIKYRPINII